MGERVNIQPNLPIYKGNCAAFFTESDTEPGLTHITVVRHGDEPGTITGACSCKGWQFNQKCKHMSYVLTIFQSQLN